jgi:hypothetical protein
LRTMQTIQMLLKMRKHDEHKAPAQDSDTLRATTHTSVQFALEKGSPPSLTHLLHACGTT